MAYSSLSRLCLWAFKPREGALWGERALELGERLGDAHVEARALMYLGSALAELGEAARGVAAIERGLGAARRTACQECVMNAHHLLGERLIALGELERGEGHLRETLALGKELGVEGFGVATESVLAVLELERGARGEAERLLEATQRTVEAALPFMRYLVAPVQGERLMRQGRLGEARDALERALPDGRAAPHTLHELLPVLARVRLAEGGREGAVAAMDRWLEAWHRSEPTVSSGPSLAAGVEVYLQTGQAAQARELVRALERLARLTPAIPALAQVEDARGFLAAHEGQCAEATAHFRLAAAYWRGLGFSYREARSRRHLAASLLLEGGFPPGKLPSGNSAREEARAELMAAREVFAALGAPLELAATDNLARRHGLLPRANPGRADGLTRREAQVIGLIAKGHSNKAIAKLLGISERTVEIHVGNILAKLGFSSRVQAATYALEQGLTQEPS